MSPLAMALSYQPPAAGQGTVAPTDVLGAYKASYDQQMEKYKADKASQGAMFGGLAGLGGAGINAFGKDAAKGLGGLFGGSGAAAGAGDAVAGAGGASLGEMAGAFGMSAEELLPLLMFI